MGNTCKKKTQEEKEKMEKMEKELEAEKEANRRKEFPRIHEQKPQMNQPEYDHFHGFTPRHTFGLSDLCSTIKKKCECSGRCIGKTIVNYLPFIRIMKMYEMSWFPLDLVAGLTIGIMQVPEAMAYSLLAELEPVTGLYVCFFPVIIYYFFGTSRHVCCGAFSVIALLVGTTVEKFDCTGGGDFWGEDKVIGSTGSNLTSMFNNATTEVPGSSAAEMACKLSVATAVTFLAGCIQFLLGLVKFGLVVRYLSVPLTRGFTTGCAIHVFSSQIKYMVGLSPGSYSGPLKLVYQYRDLFLDITNINWAAVIGAILCMGTLYVVKEYVNPPVQKKIKAPIPIELIIVIIGTVASYYADFEHKFNLKVVGEIPTGLPAPRFPPIQELFGDIILDALILAIVAFAISVSMAQLFADKYNYEIDANQELVAHGLGNAVAANFNCYMMCVSLSRSSVLDSIGVKSQLYALFSCSILVLVIYFVAHLFRTLPNVILASIIIIAMKGLFKQFTDISKYWKISKTDMSVWVVACLAVVLLDVGLGLLVGVVYGLLTVIGRTQQPYASLLGKMAGSKDYKDVAVFKNAEEIPGVKIFRYDNAVYYANKDHYLNGLFDMSGNNPKHMKARMTKYKNRRARLMKGKKGISESEAEAMWPTPKPDIHHVVVDCSVISYADATGAIALKQSFKEFKDIGVDVFFANMNDGVREMLKTDDFFESCPDSFLYPSVHDAVYAALDEYPEQQLMLVNNVVDIHYLEDDSQSPHHPNGHIDNGHMATGMKKKEKALEALEVYENPIKL